MYKMVVIDDEKAVVDGMRQFIDWSELGIEIVACAGNGLEGLEKVLEYEPEIVITDIHMPKMDGVDLIKHIFAHNSNIKVVTFSGFEEFAYIKECLKYGIVDYILKPSTPDEIKEIMGKVVKLCNDDRHTRLRKEQAQQAVVENNYNQCRQFIEALLASGAQKDSARIQQKIHKFGLEKLFDCCVVVSFKISDNEIFAEETHLINPKEFESILCEVFVLNPGCLNTNISEGHFICGLNGCLESEETKTFLAAKVDEANQRILKLLGTTLFFAVGIMVTDPVQLAESFKHSATVLKQIGWKKIPSIFYYETYIDCVNHMQQNVFFDREKFIHSLRSRNQEQAEECIREMFVKTSNEKIIPLKMLERNLTDWLGIIYNNANYSVQTTDNSMIEVELPNPSEILCEADNLDQVEQRLFVIVNKIWDSFLGKNRRNLRLVALIVDYVEKNYNKDPSLTAFSKKVYLTPNYLSNIFTAEMGENFSSYLMRYRISMAKKLLKTGDYKIYEIVDMVGYKSPEYFSKIFKYIEGVTPSEYIK